MKVGTKLKNGAEVIDFQGDYVLAKFNGQYVTWIVDDDGVCFLGHYYNDFEQAYNDFVSRRMATDNELSSIMRG